MFTTKDVGYRTILVVNCLEQRSLRVRNGELLLEELSVKDDKTKVLTKLPFQKILAVFVIGSISITTPLIDKCREYGVALVVTKLNLRPVFFWSTSAEANYLLRQRQYTMSPEDLTIAKVLIANKLSNQLCALQDTRYRDDLTLEAIARCRRLREQVTYCSSYTQLMGIEGVCAKVFFEAFFQDLGWEARRPRAKCDAVNATLDIGYTILFNYIECFVRLFGFDLYVGVLHKCWYKRKSLVCDLVEPFRCLVDKTVRKAFNRQQFVVQDFEVRKGEYLLRGDRRADYHRVFFGALMPYRAQVFAYVQSYYRCFMQCKSEPHYPQFLIKDL